MNQIQQRLGVIFDVDGTMWDSTEIVAGAWNRVLAARGMPQTLNAGIMKQEFGKTLDEIGADLLPEFAQDEQRDILHAWFASEEQALREQIPSLYDGLGETLRYLAARYPLFIVSNAQAGYIELFLEKTGFGPLFRGFLSNGDTSLPKDGNIRLIMDRFHLMDAVYVGDTVMDHAASAKARVRFAYASYGFGDVPSWDYLLRSPRDLMQCRLFPDFEED